MPTIAQSIFRTQTITTSGSLTQIGIAAYWDSDLTDYVSTIDWPTLNPGENTTVALWIMNTGTAPVVLRMITENYTPQEASSYLAVTWNTEGHTLNPGESTQTTITLSVDTQAQFTGFSFDMTIEGLTQ